MRLFQEDNEKVTFFLVIFEAEVLEKPKAQIGVLKELFNRLAEVLRDCPAQYYRWAETILKLILLVSLCLSWL